MSRIDFYFGSPPCEAFAPSPHYVAGGSVFNHRGHYIVTGCDIGVAGGDRSAFAAARRVADAIIIDDIHVADDTPESRAKFNRWYQEAIEMYDGISKSDHEARRLSPEKPYAVLTQFMWEGGTYSGTSRLCTSLRTFATAAEAEKFAATQAVNRPRQIFYVIGATAQLVSQPPAPPATKLQVTVLSPAKRKRIKRKARKSKGRRRA